MSSNTTEPFADNTTGPAKHHPAFLDDVLVLSVQKNFWASTECEIFPHRLYAKPIFSGRGRWGSSRNPLNMLTLAFQGYFYAITRRPRLILFGAAPRITGWFAQLKRFGLLPGVKMVAPGALYLNDAQAKHFDRLFVFSRDEISQRDSALREKFVFIPLPADGDFTKVQPVREGDYIFAGGGAGRDFATLVEAVKGLDIRLKIVTFSPKTLGYDGELPKNCEVLWKMPVAEFLSLMAGALFVVVPLYEGLFPHGHTTVVQALRLGKVVITTQNATVNDYITDGCEGLMVPPGNVAAYREAILQLMNKSQLRESLESYVARRMPQLTYQAFAQNLVELCRRALISQNGNKDDLKVFGEDV